MDSAKEKVKDMGSVAKEHVEIYKAKLEEKVLSIYFVLLLIKCNFFKEPNSNVHLVYKWVCY